MVEKCKVFPNGQQNLTPLVMLHYTTLVVFSKENQVFFVIEEKLNISKYQEQFDVANVHEMSLHSTGNADEMDEQEFNLEYNESRPPVRPLSF